ncbi:MAG: hypothetical protein AAF600_15415 [Bacteroidota bacterium]
MPKVEVQNQDDNSFQDLQDLLERKPRFLNQWTYIVYIISFIVLILGLSLLPVQEKIVTEAKLTSVNASKKVIARVNANLTELSVLDQQYVDRGHLIGVMESNANYRQVLMLDTLIKKLLDQQVSNYSVLETVFSDQINHLGALQEPYRVIKKDYIDHFRRYLESDYFNIERQLLEHEINHAKTILQYLTAKRDLLRYKFKLAEEKHLIKKSLFDSNVISRLEYLDEENAFILEKMALSQLDMEIQENENELIQKKSIS